MRYVRRSLFHRNEWKEILEKSPILAGFNTTGICNARCCYCAYQFQEPDGVMGMSIYEKGVREFSDMGGGIIGLSPVTGEPLVDPHFTERIESAARFSNLTAVTFDTNGILLKDHTIREALIELSSWIQINMIISLPGFDKAMFERVYNIKWDDAILYGIEELLQANRERNHPIRITFSFQPDRAGVLQEPNFTSHILPYIDKEDAVMIGLLRDNWCGQIEQKQLSGDMVLMRRLKVRRIPCEIMLDRHVDILVNGDVRMCGCTYGREGKHDDLVIGNIQNDSLSDLWFGPGPAQLCERYFASDPPVPCRKCAMYMPY
jgi:MoaA/NifB/PqqE/SkfB family radical SAM enzyme